MDIEIILMMIVMVAITLGVTMHDMLVNDRLRARARDAERREAKATARANMMQMERDTVLQRDAAKRSHECRIRDDEIQRLKDMHKQQMKELSVSHQKEMESLYKEYNREKARRETAETVAAKLMDGVREDVA